MSELVLNSSEDGVASPAKNVDGNAKGPAVAAHVAAGTEDDDNEVNNITRRCLYYQIYCSELFY